MPKSKPQADPLARMLHELTDMEGRLNALSRRSRADETALCLVRSAEGLDAEAWTELKRSHGLDRWTALPVSVLAAQGALLPRLELEIARSRQCATPLSLALVRADAENADTSGLVLPLQEQARAFDLVCALDEECVAVVFCGCALAQAERLVGSMLRRLRQARGEVNGQALCSAGLVGYGGLIELSAPEFVSRARQSLEKARTLGGNRLEVAPPLDVSAAPRTTLVGASEKHFLFTGKRMPQK